MVTNINLPIVLAFENKDHVKDFIEAAQEIIPKLKYTHIAGEGYTCIIYTRKDKNYRSLMVVAEEAPVAIEEAMLNTEPVEPTLYVNYNADMVASVATIVDTPSIETTDKAIEETVEGAITGWYGLKDEK